MSRTPTIRRPADVELTDAGVRSIVVAAVLGSIAFGIVMSLTLGNVLFTAIPAMYGLEGLSSTEAVLFGWGIHISHGTVLGGVFGVVITLVPACGRRLGLGLVAGVVYGIILWLALGSVVMPIWVNAATSLAPPVPDFQPWSLIGHILYGSFVGLLIPLYRRH